MESYCVFLAGNFIAVPMFERQYGIPNPADPSEFIIESKWQSALQVGGPLGALIGVVLAGPLTSAIGYRWATISGLMLLNAFIFIFYFAKSLSIMLLAQLLEGIPWGIFIANAPAYCSEIVPIQLRAPATQMLQMFWAIGAIIVGAITYVYNEYDSEDAYRFVPPRSTIQGFAYICTPEFLLRCSGCFLHLLLSSSSAHRNHLGGWFERGVLMMQFTRWAG